VRGAGHPAGERREYRYRRDACRRHGRGRARAGALWCATGSATLAPAGVAFGRQCSGPREYS
jgi:hypothetical protein